MRRIDDYFDEMDPLAISDSDVERLLRGEAPAGPGLTRLGLVLDELRAVGARPLAPEVISRHVATSAEAAREATPPPQRPVEHPARTAPRWRLVPRLGASLAAFALLLGMSGVAVASNSSAPGDTLHGIDMFLENLGLGDGGIRERIAEARALAERGETVGALDHLSISLPGEEETGAREALKAAASRIGTEPSAETQTRVHDMVEWMATTDIEGMDFGLGVAERARTLGGKDPNPAAGEVPPGNPRQDGASSQDNQPQRGDGRRGPPPGRGGR